MSCAGFTSDAPPAAPIWMLCVPNGVPMIAGSVGFATREIEIWAEPLSAPAGNETSAPEANVTVPPVPATFPCAE